MDPSSNQEKLIRRIAGVLGRFDRARAGFEGRHGDPPQPGDLFVFQETARFDVQWAILDRHPRDRGHFLVVPADHHPQVGSTDIAVGSQAPCGALTLRCRFGSWLPENAFVPEMRTGFLLSEHLEKARIKRSEIERGTVHGSSLERETDVEPEYQDWAEGVLAKAQAALSELGGEAAESRICWNGIYGDTGEALLPSADVSQVAVWAQEERIDPDVLRLLKHVHDSGEASVLGLPDGEARCDLEQKGWGVVFHADEKPAVRDALEALIEHRRTQAGPKTKILDYQTGEGWQDWLARHEVGADEVRPASVPYYLLLVGSPERIPFEFQVLLGVEYAVGRLSFEKPENYRRYAESLVDAERLPASPVGRSAVFFGPRHPSDPVTRLTAEELLRPLVTRIRAQNRDLAQTRLWGEAATKAQLVGTLHTADDPDTEPPSLIFCAGHSVNWPQGHPQQIASQGALLCQDWPGSGKIEAGHYFEARDLTNEARLHGSIVFLVASFSAGTPAWKRRPGEPIPQMAETPFVARLPERLLAHPRGGALAVVGLVGPLRGYAVATPAREALQPLRSGVDDLLRGAPVGHALRELNERYAALTVSLNDLLTKRGFGARVPDREIVAAWVERDQARSYVVLGDPAARLRSEKIRSRF